MSRPSPDNRPPGVTNRRRFLAVSALLATAAVARAQESKVDGGLAPILPKEAPRRGQPLKPAGSLGHRNFSRHCTGCQLCVTACPNHVLCPSGSGLQPQPEMSYENGYCRPECTRCSEVCPTGAIHRITAAEKSATQIGHAVWLRELCLVNKDGIPCNSCARHCPAGAIHMAPRNPAEARSPRIPVIDTERCIGCGACEHLCPSRPRSAIYVEGHELHRTV